MNFRWPPAWLLVLVGLVLNILAILMSSVVLEDLSSKMSGFNERKQDNLYAIQLAWNRVETLERKKELALIYLSQSDSVSHSADASLVASELTKQLSDWVGEPVPSLLTTNLNQIMAVIERAQKTQREQIDNFYLQNLTFNERLSALDEQIAWYRNISLFLQVFGLALILARDLARK